LKLFQLTSEIIIWVDRKRARDGSARQPACGLVKATMRGAYGKEQLVVRELELVKVTIVPSPELAIVMSFGTGDTLHVQGFAHEIALEIYHPVIVLRMRLAQSIEHIEDTCVFGRFFCGPGRDHAALPQWWVYCPRKRRRWRGWRFCHSYYSPLAETVI